VTTPTTIEQMTQRFEALGVATAEMAHELDRARAQAQALALSMDQVRGEHLAEQKRADALHKALEACLEALELAASAHTDFLRSRYGLVHEIIAAQRALDDGARR
jgi:hypothetical protein